MAGPQIGILREAFIKSFFSGVGPAPGTMVFGWRGLRKCCSGGVFPGEPRPSNWYSALSIHQKTLVLKQAWCHMAGPQIGILREAFIKSQLL